MTVRVLLVVALGGVLLTPHTGQARSPSGESAAPAAVLDRANWLFYSGRYAAAAELAGQLCAGDGLAACELRSTALLFQIRRALGPAPQKDALKRCTECEALISEFQATVTRGQTLARTRLREAPEDEQTQFLLGKLNLNHVWLHVGTLGRKTGLGEYREARKVLDRVLDRSPDHVRARVARAWIDYIVGSRVPRGMRWMLGGGNKSRGLQAAREAASMDADFFVRAEARFALWDMQVRERNMQEAVMTARGLARDFPGNEELNKFVASHHGVVASSR